VPAHYSLEEGSETYNWVSRYTLEFLDAYLKHDVAALAFLRRTPDENGVARHLIAASFRPASGKQVSGGDPSLKVKSRTKDNRQILAHLPLQEVWRSGILSALESGDYSVDRATTYLRTAPLVQAVSRVRTGNAAGDPRAG
jgi:hypothetical protein